MFWAAGRKPAGKTEGVHIFLFPSFWKAVSRSELNFSDLSDVLYSQLESSSSFDQRVSTVLEFSAEVLGFRNAAFFIHENEICTVANIVQPNERKCQYLVPGSQFSKNALVCGNLSAENPLISIDRLGDTQWRQHSSFQLLGWETFLGAYRPTTAGAGVSVCFFDTIYRSKKLGAAETEMAQLLAKWISGFYMDELKLVPAEIVDLNQFRKRRRALG